MEYRKTYHPKSGVTELCTIGKDSSLKMLEFYMIELHKDESAVFETKGREAAFVFLSGNAYVKVDDGTDFGFVGGRKSVFEGKAHTVYAGRNRKVTFSTPWSCRIAVAAAPMAEDTESQLITPDMVKALQQKCLQMAKDFALAQIKAGSNIMGVGDAICSQISQDMYDEFCLPLHRELFKFIHDNGAIVKLHICGDITHILPSLAKADVDILDVDWMVDMAEAHKTMGDGVMVCGNIDPVTEVLEGTEASIKSKFDAIKASVPMENWIFMAGCEIPRDSPVGNVRYMREISMKK